MLPGTKARSNEVNTNFSNYRGHNIPINELTSTASHLTHDLGTSEHRWRDLYIEEVNLSAATTTVSHIIQGDPTLTAGAINFKIGGTLSAQILPGGIPASSIIADQIMQGVTFTKADLGTVGASWTVPAGVTKVWLLGCGGGNGGGGGSARCLHPGTTTASTAAGGGGGGGAGSVPMWIGPFVVTPLGVLSISIGDGGAGGGPGSVTSSNGLNGAVGGVTTLFIGGTAACTFGPSSSFPTGSAGLGGSGIEFVPCPNTNAGSLVTLSAGGLGGNMTFNGRGLQVFGGNGGRGQTNTTPFNGQAGLSGGPSIYGYNGGTGGNAIGSGGGGGGGGGAGYGGNGGNGGSGGTAGAGAVGQAGQTATGIGAGGGGGGGGAITTTGQGGRGGDGGPGMLTIFYIR